MERQILVLLRRKGATKDEMVGWHHWLNGPKFEPTPGDSEGQGSLLYYSPQVAKCLTRLNNNMRNLNGLAQMAYHQLPFMLITLNPIQITACLVQ